MSSCAGNILVDEFGFFDIFKGHRQKSSWNHPRAFFDI